MAALIVSTYENGRDGLGGQLGSRIENKSHIGTDRPVNKCGKTTLQCREEEWRKDPIRRMQVGNVRYLADFRARKGGGTRCGEGRVEASGDPASCITFFALF